MLPSGIDSNRRNSSELQERVKDRLMRTARICQLPGRLGRVGSVCALVAVVLMPCMSWAQTPAQSTGANSQSQVSNTSGDQGWPPDASNLRLEMIGNAHIDAPWLWPLSETNAIVHSTF